MGEPVPISSAHGENVPDLIERALALCPAPVATTEDSTGAAQERVKVAIVGRPNVGKSTLVNTLLGEDRVLALDEPGTTRDALYLDFDRGNAAYTLIDTAGVRRRGKVSDTIEKFSVIKTLQAIEDANVVVLLLDAPGGVSEQDAHIAGHILEAGRALVVAANKWDAVTADAKARARARARPEARLPGFRRVAQDLGAGRKGAQPGCSRRSIARTARRWPSCPPRGSRGRCRQRSRGQQPPRTGLVRPKLRYAHQGGMNPPLIVIHGSALGSIPGGYRRYLEHFFREAFQLQGTPLRIQFKTGANPYADGRHAPAETALGAPLPGISRGRRPWATGAAKKLSREPRESDAGRDASNNKRSTR